MRTFSALAALTLLSLPLTLHAQDLQRPEGWHARFDKADASEADLEMWVNMPPGWHITTGPAGIFWDPSLTAAGDFRAEMEVFLFDPGQRREAFGIFFGGKSLDGDAHAYSYFLIRNGGEFIVKRRQGDASPTLLPWSRNAAILSYADRGDDASVKNVLTVEAEGDTVRFLINGAEVATLPRGDVLPDGVVGLRVNHALNLHVSRLEVSPLR